MTESGPTPTLPKSIKANMETIIPKESFPLTWPERHPRTAPYARNHARFKNNTLGRCCDDVQSEIGRLGGKGVIISTNIEPRLDGRPYANKPAPRDPGVAVYFMLDKRPMVLACDKWLTVEDNLWAIVKDIEATRGKLRWGASTVQQAFAGYTAIPERTGGVSWWTVLGVAMNASEDQIRDAYRAKAKLYHPDSGSSPDSNKMVELNEAYRMATSQKTS